MSNYVLWIDSEHAKIFKTSQKIAEPVIVKKSGGDHHGADHFFHEVAKILEKADELLIVGPGLAKNQFKAHLEKEHHQLAKKVVAIETVDHPTDAQILSSARKSFSSIHNWI